MIEEIKKHGKLITYTILPASKDVSFVVLPDEGTFVEIVNKHNGIIQENFDANLNDDTLFHLRFPAYDFSGKTKFFKLNNGAIAIDQSLSRKGNPYYICNSFEDYELITKYLVVYKDEKTNDPIVECTLLNHRLIKNFLKTIELTEEKDIELAENHKLFKAPNGYYMMINALPASCGMQDFFGMYEKINADEDIYIGLTIYESLELMKYLGVFEPDE